MCIRDSHFIRRQRELEVTGQSAGELDVEAMMAEELQAIEAADITLVCSAAEQQLLTMALDDVDVRVLSNIHTEVAGPANLENRNDILFVGSFEHPPNADGLIWFIDHVLPHVQAEKPDIALHVVGSDPPTEVLDRASANVKVHGHVDDLVSHYGRVRLAVAPLRFGAGVKGKVTQALAVGVPLIGTQMAVEGAGIEPNQHALVADDAEGFATAVLQVLSDDDLWQRLRKNGLSLTKALYSPWAARPTIEAVCTTATGARP